MLAKLRRNADILIILLIGISIRVFYLLRLDFWYDEAFVGVLMRLPLNEFWQALSIEPHPPLYYLIIKVWTTILGVNDLSLRGFSLICGILTILFAYKIARKLFNTDVAGIIATFCAINPFLIAYSVEARSYAFFGLLVLINFYFIIERRYILFTIWSVVLAFTFYLSIVYLAILIFYFVMKEVRLKQKQRENYLKNRNFLYVIPPFITVAYSAFTAFTRKNDFNSDWIIKPEAESIIKTLWAFIFGIKSKLTGSENLLNPLNYPMSLETMTRILCTLFLVMTVVYFVKNRKHLEKKTETLFLALSAIVPPIAVLVLYNFNGTNIYLDRYMFPSSIFVIFLIGLFLRKTFSFEISALILLTYVFLLGRIIMHPYDVGMKTIGDRFREESRELVVTSPLDYMVARYYLGEEFSKDKLKIEDPASPDQIYYGEWPLTPPNTEVINQNSAIYISSVESRMQSGFEKLESSVDFGTYSLYTKDLVN